MIHDRDNPHTERFPFCQAVYWAGNTACGKLDDWTHCDVQSFGQFPRLRFERGRESERDSLIHMLQLAFECGRKAKALELRLALEVSP